MIASAVRLDRTTRAGVDLDLGSRREPGGQPPQPPPHGERVTISTEGRAASRDSVPAVRGDVRWYRAARYGRGRGPVAANADGYEDARSGLVFLVDPNRTNPQDPTQLFMLVSSEKWVLQPGESTVVTVFVFTMEGFAVSGASLKVSIRGAIIQIVDGVRDRLNGVYTFTLTAGSVSGATGYSLQIDATKFGYALATLRIGFLIVP